MAIAERWLAAHFNQPGLRRPDRLQRLRHLRRRRHDGGRSRTRPPRSPATCKLSNLCWIYDNNHITIEGNTSLAFSEDVADAVHGLRLERHPRRRRQRPRRCSTAPSRRSCRHDRPADADHRRQPHRLGRAQQAGHPRRPRRAAGRGGDPAHQEGLRLARGRQVPRPRRRLRALPRRASASAARSCATPGSSGSSEYKAKYPELADQLYRMQHRQLPDGWDKDLPTLPGRRQGHGHARARPARCSTPSRKNVPWLIGGAADLAPSTKTLLTFEGAGDFEAGQLRRPQLPLRHPRARDGRHPQRHGAVQGAALRRRASSSSATTAGRRSGWPRSWSCRSSTSSRTTRSASARTARPTSRSSSLPSLRAIPGLIVIRPGDANEVVEAWRVIMPLHHQPAALVLTRQDLPTLDRTKYAPASGVAQGRLRPRRRRRRQARRDPARHRQRGLALRRGVRDSSRPRGSRPAS